MTDQTTRTPYAHKIRYGITGAPTLTEDEMDGSHAPGIGVAPTLIELVYSAARDGKPASVTASVTGDWTRFGERADGQVTVHFKNGPDGWPAWLAEEARLHDPDAASSAGRAPAADRAALREQIRRAVCEAEGFAWDSDMLEPDEYGDHADAVLAVLPDVLPAPTDRAAVLREAADFLRDAHFRDGLSVQEIGTALRHMAREAQQEPTQDGTFIPPAAFGLPAGTLEAAEIGANRLDAWARTPNGRNFLAHALVQLARTGWLRTEPGEGFEPDTDNQTPQPKDARP